MDADPKRMAQACRIYAALLRCYPLSFQQEYGDTVAQQFRDEYRDVAASEKPLSLFRFWMFIVFDFLHSFLREYQEEVARMVKKNFFVYCAIAAGLVTLLILPPTYQWFFHYDKLDMWSQLLFYPLFIGCGALASFGLATVSKSHLIFRVLPLILLAFAVSTIPIPVQNPPYGWVGRPAFTFVYANEDRFLGRLLMAYFFLTMILCIAAFAKRKWLPGACLLAINLPMLIPNLAYAISEDSPIVEYTWNRDWFTLFVVSVYLLAWFGIAWWLKKESGETPVQKALEAA